MALSTLSGNDDVNIIKKENEVLLEDITRYCNRQDYKKETILLISKSGQGKSAIVNTLIRVFIDEYLSRADVGKGVAQTKSMELIAYKCCGITPHDFKDPESPLVDIAEKLFTLMDFAGLADEDTLALREKLELLIGDLNTIEHIRDVVGRAVMERSPLNVRQLEQFVLQECGPVSQRRVPLGTTILQLEKDQTELGIGNLATRKYREADPNRMIHKVVFAQGCNDDVPKKLINCLQTVLKKVDENTGHLKYKVTVFPMITKYDIVKEEPDIEIIGTNSTGMDNSSSGYTSLTSENGADDGDQIQQTVTLKDFGKVEARVARLFNVEGALKYNCFRWVSHCDSIGYDANPHITNNALKFVKRMVSPGAPKMVEPPPVLGMWTRIQLFMSDRVAECNTLGKHNINVSPMVLLMAIVGLVVIFFMYRLLADNPTSGK